MAAPARRSKGFALDAHPTEQELIASHLGPRVASGDRSSGSFIHDGDVYGAHPADLTREYAAAVASNGDEAWYFFTAVRARGGGRKGRTVDSGEGCWHSEAGSKPVVSAHHHQGVGYRQNFSFVTNEGGARVRSGWLMVELGLRDDGKDEVTLCKVYFSPRAAGKNHKKPACKRKAAAADTTDDALPPERKQCRRRRARPDHPAEEQDHVKAGKQEESSPEEISSPDEPEVEDRSDFYWWLRNKDQVRMECGMSKESFYHFTFRSPFEGLFDRPADPCPVVRQEDRPIIMYSTFDEMYDLPMAKEFFSTDKILEEMSQLRTSRSTDDDD